MSQNLNNPPSYTIVLFCEQQNKTFNIDLQPDTTIEELSNHLVDSLNCQQDERIVLYFQNRELQNGTTLEQNGVGKGRQVVIKIEKIQRNMPNNQSQQNVSNQNQQNQNQFNQNQSQVININIEVPVLDKNYTMKIDQNKQVKDLIAGDQTVTFQFKGIALNSVENTLKQYGLTDNCTITAGIQAKGGQ